MVMTMEALDRIFKEQTVGEKDTLEQLAAIERLQEPTLKVEGVQVDPGSKLVTLYHRVTGEPRTIPRVYAPSALLKRYKIGEFAGQLVFSTTPTVPYVLGSVKCLLHPSRAERGEYDALGLPVCKGEHFPSEFEATRHTQVDHASAWLRLENIKTERRREEDRKLQLDAIQTQNEVLKSLAANMQQTSSSVSKRTKRTPKLK